MSTGTTFQIDWPTRNSPGAPYGQSTPVVNCFGRCAFCLHPLKQSPKQCQPRYYQGSVVQSLGSLSGG